MIVSICAGVCAALAKDLAQQFAATVRHQVVLGEIRCRIDQAHHLDDAPDPLEIADRGIVLASGSIAVSGTGEELLHNKGVTSAYLAA